MTIMTRLTSQVRTHLYITILNTDAIHRPDDKMSFSFPLGTPFRPYELLMGVLPLASKDNIPSAYHVRIFFHIHFHPLT
jgi:hypothetical protein